MKVTITSADIANGKKGNVKFCPIVLSIKRNFWFKPTVWVNDSYVFIIRSFWSDPLWLKESRYDLPEEATKFVRAFDAGETVQPFSFEI